MTRRHRRNGKAAASHIVGSVAIWGSSIGLFCLIGTCVYLLPIGEYDDSLLLLGARLRNAGLFPYLDFYTHYGPLGYTIMAALLTVLNGPHLALRTAELAMLFVVIILGGVLYAAPPRSKHLIIRGVLGSLAIFAASAVDQAFLGFSLATITVILVALSWRVRRLTATVALALASGTTLAAAFLVRPAFAAYVGGALVLLEVAASSPRLPAATGSTASVGLMCVTAVLVAVGVWAWLYSAISPGLAFGSLVVAPARLTGTGGARFLHPAFLSQGSGVVRGVLASVALFAATTAWALFDTGRKARRVQLVCAAVAGIVPMGLKGSHQLGRDASAVALAGLVLAGVVVVADRDRVRSSASTRAAAMFGLAGAAFGHYYWVRADFHHLAPMLSLAAAGALLSLRSQGIRRWAAICGIYLFIVWSAVPGVMSAGAGRIVAVARERSGRSGAVRRDDSIEAVRFADQHADPGSRFVAVGSSQAWSSADPVRLFLLSRRLPYTRWFQYDPGLQDTLAIQREMECELVESHSETAVVWQAQRYLVDESHPWLKGRSAFDVFFDRLYPTTVARFGPYIVRSRSAVRTSGDVGAEQEAQKSYTPAN